MHRIIFLSVTLSFLIFQSCNDNVETELLNTSYQSKIEGLEQMYSLSFEHLNQNMSLFVTNKKGIAINKLVDSSLNFLKNDFITRGRIDLQASDLELTNRLSFPNTRTLEDNLSIQLANAFGEESRNMLQPLVDELTKTSELKDMSDVVDDFYAQVINSTLSEDDKIQLLSTGAGIKSLSIFFSDNGNLERFKNAIFSNGNSNGRLTTKSCRINWRNVWASAVIGFAYNAGRGAIIGCAGGTLVLPLFGTATGCIGGAVFGGASGFFAGASFGIAGELLTSCWR